MDGTVTPVVLVRTCSLVGPVLAGEEEQAASLYRRCSLVDDNGLAVLRLTGISTISSN